MTLPIPRPGKIVCVGLNYKDHAEEQGVELPAAPLLFAKFTTSLIGPGEPIVIPSLVTKCDYEAELGVVIGTTVRNVSQESALEAVAGYVVANDVSARDLQFADGQWTRGKSPDTFCPIGPRLGHVLGSCADDDAELGLVVDLGRLVRQHDRVPVADQRVRPLGEQQRRLGDLLTGLLCMVEVVQPDADDLAGTAYR